jgi:hypothetical protein
MPQKTRREKERAAARRESGQYRVPPPSAPIEMPAPDAEFGITTSMPSATAARAAAPHHALPISADSDFDYGYVYADLRRIAILAVLCFGIMFALYFVLNR